MPSRADFIAEILRDFGHELPEERALEGLIQKALDEVGSEPGLDPETSRLLLAPFGQQWAEGRFEARSAEGRARRSG